MAARVVHFRVARTAPVLFYLAKRAPHAPLTLEPPRT